MVSRANKLTKQVIWSKKSIKRAIPAYKAKARTAGMSDKAPENRYIVIMNISKITNQRSRTLQMTHLSEFLKTVRRSIYIPSRI